MSVVSLKKTGLTVRSHAWDSNLGGRDLDELLFQHFCAEFKVGFTLGAREVHAEHVGSSHGARGRQVQRASVVGWGCSIRADSRALRSTGAGSVRVPLCTL